MLPILKVASEELQEHKRWRANRWRYRRRGWRSLRRIDWPRRNYPPGAVAGKAIGALVGGAVTIAVADKVSDRLNRKNK